MKLFIDNDLTSLLKNKRIFLDNDFLSGLLFDENLLKETLKFASDSYLMVDPFTEIEFLRDVYLPEQRKLREEFLTKDIFTPAPNHQQIFIQLQENAVLLSKIYALSSQAKDVDFVDLFLSARVMLNAGTSILITGNKKHYPNCVFDTLSIINKEKEKDDSFQSFYVIKFNIDKFNKNYSKLLDLEKKVKA